MHSFILNFTVASQLLSSVLFPFSEYTLGNEPVSDAEVEVVVERSNLMVAPEGISFRLIYSGFDTNTAPTKDTHDRSFVDKYVFYDYGDDYEYDAPDNLYDPRSRRSGFSRGPLGYHKYREAGNYVARVLVFESSSGKWATGVVRIGNNGAELEDTPAILSPDDFFGGPNTFYVKSVSNATVTNPPVGSVTYTDMHAACNDARSSPTPKRVMLALGEDIETAASITNSSGSNYQNLRNFTLVSEQGEGPRAIVRAAAGFGGPFFWDESMRKVPLEPRGVTHDEETVAISAAAAEGTTLARSTDTVVPQQYRRDFVVQGIEFIGPWDAVTETGDSINCIASGGQGADYCMITDCSFSGFTLAVTIQGLSPKGANRLVIYDNLKITHWRNMALFNSSGAYRGRLDDTATAVIRGCKIAQPVNANYGGEKNGNFNEHGPFRFAVTDYGIAQGNDLYSGTGWFEGTLESGEQGLLPAQQSCMRLNTSANPGAHWCVSDNTCEGGDGGISALNADTVAGQPVNFLIEYNYTLGTALTVNGFQSSYSGFTYRHNVVVFPNVPRDLHAIGAFYSGAPRSLAQIRETRTSDPSNYSTLNEIYGNTFVNLVSTDNARRDTHTDAEALIAARAEEVFIGEEYTNVESRDNLMIQVAQQGGPELLALMEGVQVITPRYPGIKGANHPTLLAEFGTPLDAGKNWFPRAGQSGVLGLSSVRPPVDMQWIETPANAAIGANEIQSI